MSEIDTYLPFQADDSKARQFVAKVKRSLKSFSVSNSKTITLPPKDELYHQKYHKFYLQLRDEGLSLKKLVDDAMQQEESSESSIPHPKYINSRFLDMRYNIFIWHQPFRADVSEISYDMSLRFGQIVAFHAFDRVMLGMVATKIEENLYRVFNLAEDFFFMICTADQICPFPNILASKNIASAALKQGTKVIGFSFRPSPDKRDFSIKVGVVQSSFSSNGVKYNVLNEDSSSAIYDEAFVTPFISPFTSDKEAVENKELLAYLPIDPTVLLDPKEARKIKQVKKPRPPKKKPEQTTKENNNEGNNSNSNNKPEHPEGSTTTMITRSTRNTQNKAIDGDSQKEKTNSNEQKPPLLSQNFQNFSSVEMMHDNNALNQQNVQQIGMTFPKIDINKNPTMQIQQQQLISQLSKSNDSIPFNPQFYKIPTQQQQISIQQQAFLKQMQHNAEQQKQVQQIKMPSSNQPKQYHKPKLQNTQSQTRKASLLQQSSLQQGQSSQPLQMPASVVEQKHPLIQQQNNENPQPEQPQVNPTSTNTPQSQPLPSNTLKPTNPDQTE